MWKSLIFGKAVKRRISRNFDIVPLARRDYLSLHIYIHQIGVLLYLHKGGTMDIVGVSRRVFL